MIRFNWLMATALAFVLLFLGMFFFTVYQTQEALTLRFGKIVKASDDSDKPAVFGPGLHFKIPFADQIKHFDIRLRTLQLDSSRIVTVEQKDVIVDAFVKWRIKDLATYYKSTSGNVYNTENLLRQKLNDSLRAAFGRLTIQELVSGKRLKVMGDVKNTLAKVAASLGVSVIDVRIKRIDLPGQVTDSVYARMRSDREKEASLIRAEGTQNAEKIQADADAKSSIILSKARSESAKIRAQGQAEAASIYAKTYERDPEFYRFYRSLEAYDHVFTSKGNTLVLTPDSDFFKYFKIH